MREMV